MRRYQNPDVFEPLAMAYALGTLRGRARERFKKLMAQHFYLRVVAEAYEQQFAGLVGLLPPQEPSPEVWRRLEAELGLAAVQNKQGSESAAVKQTKKASVWPEWLHWPALVLASMLAAVITVVMLNGSPATTAYFAKLHSPSLESVAMAAVSKDDMEITVALTDKIRVAEGMAATLWCYSKNPHEKPIRMGALKSRGNNQMTLGVSDWQGLEHISKLAISLEPVDQADATEPVGEVVFSGALMRGEGSYEVLPVGTTS